MSSVIICAMDEKLLTFCYLSGYADGCHCLFGFRHFPLQ